MTDIINTFIKRQTNKVLDKLDKIAEKQITNRFNSPSKTTLDEFRMTISNSGGLQRLNRFVFNIPVPESLRETIIEHFTLKNMLATQGLNIFDGTLGLLCNKISIPAKNLRTNEIKINGQTRRVPINYNWDTVTADFIDPLNGLVYNTFYEWIDLINNPVTNTGAFYDDFVKDLRLDYLNRDNEMVGYITLNEAFPISVKKADVGYAETGFMTTSVTFSYLYQTNRDYSSQMLYNVLNNLTGGSAGTLLNKATALVDKYNPAKLIKDAWKNGG